MPRFVATSYPIDMRAGSFAPLAESEVLEHSGSMVSLWNAQEQEQYIFTGSFSSFDGDDVPHAGTITGFTMYSEGHLTITGSQISFPVASFVSYVQSGNFQGFLDVLLAGNDTITGNGVNGAGGMNDYLTGGGGDDVISGLNGDDQMFGGAGYDVIYPGFGNDYVDGGGDNDSVSFNNYASVGITWVEGQASVAPGQTLTMVNVEQIQGTKFADTMTNGPGGVFHIFGADGNDKLYAGGFGCNLYGDAGDDQLYGAATSDSFHGGTGIDTVYYLGLASGVTVDLSITGNQNTGGGGLDLFPDSDIENLVGSDFADTLTGNSLANAIDGAGGDDVIDGGAGADTLDGGAGINTVSYGRATAGVTVDLTVGTAQDTLGAGLDTLKNFRNLSGSNFNDKLTGDAQDNILTGGVGNDTFIASKGTDKLDGGIGDDTFDFRAIALSDFAGKTQTLVGGTGKDLLQLPGHADQYSIEVNYSGTNETTTTTIRYKDNGFTLVTTGLDRVEFKDDIGGVAVTPSSGSLAFEMLRLSDEVYGSLTTLTHPAEALASGSLAALASAMALSAPAEGRHWTPVSALELGMTPSDFGLGVPSDPNLHYAFVEGFYAASTAGTFLNDTPEGNAIVLEGLVGSTPTLAISFRGTDQIADFSDYATFADHYAMFKPLIDGIKDFLLHNPEIHQVLVSGHSLGAGVAQYLVTELSSGPSAWAGAGHNLQLFTIGSPGSELPGADAGALPALNFINDDDVVPLLGALTRNGLVTGILAGAGALLGVGTAADAERQIMAGFGFPDVDQAAALLRSLQRKDVSGSQVIIDNHIGGAILGHSVEAHDTVIYLNELGRLLEFAHDAASPFAISALGQALAADTAYTGPTVRIAVGSSINTLTRSSYDDARYTPHISSSVYALSKDNFVLGSSATDRFVLTAAEMEAKAHNAQGDLQREFDGGAGRDVFVMQDVMAADLRMQTTNGAVSIWHTDHGVLFTTEDFVGRAWRMEWILARDKPVSLTGQALNGQTPAGQGKLADPTSATTPTFQLSAGYDYADAGDGAMTVNGSGGADVLYIGDGDKTINLGAGASTVVVRGQSAETDIIVNGGAGEVLVVAGGGTGTYYLHNSGDRVVIAGAAGFHSIHAFTDYVLPDYADELVLESGAVNGMGNDQGASLVGNSAANHLTGGAGDDLLTGKAGADILEGGGGRDLAAYAASRASATVTHNADGSWTVAAGAEGTDTVSGVELLRFADRDMSLTTQVAWSGDFNVDGGSDVLWRNTSGELYVWNSQGVGAGAFLGQTAGFVDNSWQVQAMGDYNGDGRADVLFRNADGRVYAWNSNGGAGVSFTGQGLGTTDNAWHIQHGAGDFNGDGRDDVLWRHDNGEIYLWESQGQSPTDDAFLGHSLGAIPLDWQVAGLGDFDGDGRSDILWRNTGGDVYVSLARAGANGVTLAGQSISYVPNDWQIQGVGDFNGDGRSDILWRNVSGEVYVWNSNTNADVSFLGQTLGFVATGWHIADIGDLNGDGRSDVLWRGPAGEVYAWNSHASGAVGFDGQGLGTTALDWQILTDGHP